MMQRFFLKKRSVHVPECETLVMGIEWAHEGANLLKVDNLNTELLLWRRKVRDGF